MHWQIAGLRKEFSATGVEIESARMHAWRSVSDHDDVPRKSDAEQDRPVRRRMGPRAKRKRVMWEEPPWLKPLLEEALRCVPDLNLDAAREPQRRQAAVCSSRLVAQVPTRGKERVHPSHATCRFDVYEGEEVCGQLMACSTCGAYAQLRSAGLNKPCMPTAGKNAQLKRILAGRHPHKGHSSTAVHLVEVEQWSDELTQAETDRSERQVHIKPAWLV
eukprot:6477754-Amphidinium_carterae.1